MFKRRKVNQDQKRAKADEVDYEPEQSLVKHPKTGAEGVTEINQNSSDVLSTITKAGVVVYDKTSSQILHKNDATKEDRLYAEDRDQTKNVNDKPRPKFGPMKAAANIRSTTVTDYQPDVCKDYKLTGFCGYGDTCKFLHSREDYAAGWKLDKEWLSRGNHSQLPAPEKAKQKIPFKCVICQKDYTSPVKTGCHHYFCEQCFLDQSRVAPICFICGKETHGVAKPVDMRRELEATGTN